MIRTELSLKRQKTSRDSAPNSPSTVLYNEVAAKCIHFSDEPEMVAATAARSLPSTRAGGQDDGSLTNSLKLYPITYYSKVHTWESENDKN